MAPGGHYLGKTALGDDSTRAIQRDPNRKFDSECCVESGFVDARRPETFDQSGKDGDAGAAALKRACRTLEHGNLPAESMKQIGGNETDQRSTHHNHSPVVGMESTRRWIACISHQLGRSVESPDCSSASLTIAI